MKRKAIHSSWLLALSLSLVAAPGCKKLAKRILEKQEQAAESGQAQVSPASGADEEQGPSQEEQDDYALAERISGHIDCLNFASRDAFRAKRDYARYFDLKTGPTGKEPHKVVYMSKMTTSARCVTALGKAKGQKPDLPKLDKASDTFSAALQRLDKEVTAARTYYDQKNFKDDDYAKGKQMHPSLMSAFDEFEKAHEAFEAEVKSINAGLSERRLKRLEKDKDAKLEYLSAKVVDDAKQLVKFADIEKLDELDEAGMKKAFDRYEKSVTEFENHVEANPEDAKKVVSLSFFRTSVNDLLKTSKELLRNKRDGKKLDNVSSPDITEGHPANVLKVFNELINRSNGLTFRR